MPITVSIPTPLRPYTGERSQLDLAPGTLDEVLERLVGEYPELRLHLLMREGRLRSFVNVYLNDEDVRYLGHGWTVQNEHVRMSHYVMVQDGDVLSIVPSVAGGCECHHWPIGAL